MRRNSGVDASVEMSVRIRRKGLTVAIAALCVVCNCSEPTPPPPLANGSWVGMSKGVRVQLSLAEAPPTDAISASFHSLNGAGSLITATGDSLPFTVWGNHFPGLTGLHLYFRTPFEAVASAWYGDFWGQLASDGTLVGWIDGTNAGVIGPFVGDKLTDKAIILTRR